MSATSSNSTVQFDQEKIFGIGLSKTGNTSLVAALHILGYDSIRAKTFLEAHQHEAAIDSPVAAQFQFLDKCYPNARFIYTYREYSSWEASWLTHLSNYPNPETLDYEIARRALGIDQKDDLLNAFLKHKVKVQAYFASRPGKLLEIDICRNPDPWTDICWFLGKPHPGVPFPWRNQTKKPLPSATRNVPKKQASGTDYSSSQS